MSEPMFISELIDKIQSGNIRIPSFQRGFVWDSDRVAHLMDSIFKGFPFGSLLLWRTRSSLNSEKNLGPYQLPTRDPEYPIDYILDGQQRATSIFGVFQTKLLPSPDSDTSCFDIYFDLIQSDSIQDSNFLYVPLTEIDNKRHFPLKILFNSSEYRNYLKNMDDDIAEKVDYLYKKFTTARIPVEIFNSDDRNAVAIVFERINRLGIELDTLQLLSAWTWNEDFDLQEEFISLSEELEPFGFKGVGEDSNLILRCCSAIISSDASPASIMELKGKEVRERFKEIKKGIFGAIDFLRNSLKIVNTELLPFSTIIVPLSVFFATNLEQDTNPSEYQQNILVKWIWRTFFSKRYSKRLEQLNRDIIEIRKLKNGQKSSLGDFDVGISDKYFTENQFNITTVNTKTFILLLANNEPLNFISGSPVALDEVLRSFNKKEFHHVFPKQYLKSLNVRNDRINCLCNFVIIAKSDNNTLGGNPPSIYKKYLPNNKESIRLILKKALCPENIFQDDYDKFLEDRVEILIKQAKKLMQFDKKTSK
ncbi:MAG: DUF262 domain-containing protein [Treponema sp.]|nr:DUF262 domain-containing protein [Treponema sp.]